MNIMELSWVATPVLGAIGGFVGVSAPTIMAKATGTVLGIMVGVATYFTTIGLSCLLMKSNRIHDTKKLNNFQKTTFGLAIGLLLLIPLMAFPLSYMLASWIIQLY
jgi:hypothetical protein